MNCGITKCLHLEDCHSDKEKLSCCNDPESLKNMKSLLHKIRRNSIKLGWYHNARYSRYRSFLFYLFRLPSLILSGVNGFFAIGLQKFIAQSTISFTNAIISFLCGIITSIEISLNLQKRMESELDSYKKLYRITVEIDKELTLFVNEDGNSRQRLREFTEKRYNEYQSIISLSNIVTSEVVLSEDEFDKLYKGTTEEDEYNRQTLSRILNDSYQVMPNYLCITSKECPKYKNFNDDDIKVEIDDPSQPEEECCSKKIVNSVNCCDSDCMPQCTNESFIGRDDF